MKKIENPFTSGQIKNYLLFYASILLIMVLFFIASTLFNDIEIFDKKTFDVKVAVKKTVQEKGTQSEKSSRKFKLLDKAY